MIKTSMILPRGLLPLLALGYLASCGDKSSEVEVPDPNDLFNLVESNASNVSEPDLAKRATFPEIDDEVRRLKQSPTAGSPVYGTNTTSAESFSQSTSSPLPANNQLVQLSDKGTIGGRENLNAVVDKISKSNQEQGTEIIALKRLVEEKDRRIRDYKLLNQDLRSKNQKLREALAAGGGALETNTGLSDTIQYDKYQKLKNDFAMRTKELSDYKERANVLENRLKLMRANIRGEDVNPLVTERITQSDEPTIDSGIGKLPSLESPSSAALDSVSFSTGGSGRLEFQAAVTSALGKTREAFYTEFFITKTHLDDILKSAEPTIELSEGINSYSELWARVRKNEYSYPGLQQGIRKALLAAVKIDGGKKIRTDEDGASSAIEGLAPGNYYIIGTAPLGKVGVTWCLPVEIELSSDKRVALTLNNSSWGL
jgi:hypothetical protein